jgi:hypothetical protein
MPMKRIERAAILLGLATLGAPATGCALDPAMDTDLEASEAIGERAIKGAHLSPIAKSVETTRAIDRARQGDRQRDERKGRRVEAPGSGADQADRVGPAAPLGGGPITVTGRVLQLPGAEVSFLPVAIIGQGAALADADGDFTIHNVTTPYDIVVGFSDGTDTTMVLYEGLTRPDPRLIAFVTYDRSATMDGTVSGGAGYPLPADHDTSMQLSTDHGSGGGGAVDPTTGDYALITDWTFAASTNAYLTAVQYELDGSGLVNNYTGSTAMDFPISDGAAVVMPLPLAPTKTTVIEGRYSYPPGYIFGGTFNWIEAPSFGLIPMPGSPVDNGLISLNAPIIAGRSNMVGALAVSALDSISFGLARNVAPGTSDVDLEVPEGIHTLFPFDGSTGITHATPFLVTDYSVGVHIFTFSSASGPTFYVMSDDPVASIPDLSQFAVFLPPSTAYSLSVLGLGPFADLDDFAGPTAPLPSPVLYLAQAPTIDFTTAP